MLLIKASINIWVFEEIYFQVDLQFVNKSEKIIELPENNAPQMKTGKDLPILPLECRISLDHSSNLEEF